ncbi:MAG: hypothetical protein ACTSRH_04435 [Promethearchaeota archaeon]
MTIKKRKYSRKKLKHKRNLLLFIFLFGFLCIFYFSGLGFTLLAPFNFSKVYISGNDLIKNFRIEPSPAIESDNSIEPKLICESGAYWKIYQEDLKLIDSYETDDGNSIILYYSITAKNKINIYTNVRLDQAVEKNLNPVDEKIECGKFVHRGCFGDPIDGFTDYLTWRHYDFGNLRTWNAEHNAFSGDIRFSFDINPSPLPDIFQDDDGNQIPKKFDYIAVSGITIASSKTGLLSNDVPTIMGFVPAEYEKQETSDIMGEEPDGDVHGFTKEFDPRPTLSDPKCETIDLGILPMSVGASLSPMTKNGEAIWDPEALYKSMTDCMFTYKLGALSPLIKVYRSTLTYYYQDLDIQDVLVYVPPLGFYWDFKVNHDWETKRSITRDVALHVINRYIQAEIEVTFKIFSKFDISALKQNETDLQLPQEYYNDLAWQTTVDGTGGGSLYAETSPGVNLDFIFWILIIIAIIFLCIYIFSKIALPYIMFKLGQNSARRKR